MEVLDCGNRDFRLFCSCDLDLDHGQMMTFVHELDPYFLEMCEYELPTSVISKVVV